MKMLPDELDANELYLFAEVFNDMQDAYWTLAVTRSKMIEWTDRIQQIIEGWESSATGYYQQDT